VSSPLVGDRRLLRGMLEMSMFEVDDDVSMLGWLQSRVTSCPCFANADVLNALAVHLVRTFFRAR
jgi:hypothetical protein